VDANLPACHLILNNTHTIGFGSSPEEAKTETPESPAAAPQLVFVFQNFTEDRSKNEVFGPFGLKNLSQAGFAFNGTMRVKGRIFPDPGTHPPAMVKVTVKHENAQNRAVLRTETFIIHVQPDGRILLQSFPITTTNSTGTPEQLEISAQAVDKDFPFSTTNATVTFTPLIWSWELMIYLDRAPDVRQKLAKTIIERTAAAHWANSPRGCSRFPRCDSRSQDYYIQPGNFRYLSKTKNNNFILLEIFE
jgi:hypothetical protein